MPLLAEDLQLTASCLFLVALTLSFFFFLPPAKYAQSNNVHRFLCSLKSLSVFNWQPFHFCLDHSWLQVGYICYACSLRHWSWAGGATCCSSLGAGMNIWCCKTFVPRCKLHISLFPTSASICAAHQQQHQGEAVEHSQLLTSQDWR